MTAYPDLDPRLGGRFAVDVTGFPMRGKYLVVEPPSRVIVSWGFVGSEDLPAGASQVEFRLSPIPNGIRVELIHSGLPDAELLGHQDGWEHCSPRLALVSCGWDPGPDHFGGRVLHGRGLTHHPHGASPRPTVLPASRVVTGLSSQVDDAGERPRVRPEGRQQALLERVRRMLVD